MTTHTLSLKHLPAPGPFALCALFAGLLWFACPLPTGLSLQAWHLLILFMTTILGVILKPLPMGAVCLITMMIALLSHTLKVEQAFSGFQDKVVWLVVFALFIAKGFSVTGLGNRIGYYFIALLGKSTLGLGYGVAIADLCMAPAIPSVAGRSVGIVFPIVQSIAQSFKSFPHSDSAQKIGSFLTLTLFQSTTLSSTLFLTAMAANPLIQSLAESQLHISLSWGTWALGALAPGLICFIAIPLIIYTLFPPSMKKTPEAVILAKTELRQMGPMSLAEWIMLGTVILLLVLWGGGSYFKIDPLVAAIIGLGVLLLGGVLSWRSLLQDENVWETFIWFAILAMMAKYLNEFQVITWIRDWMAAQIEGFSWTAALPLLTLFYFYVHYFFASSTAHVLAMFVAIAHLVISLGAPPLLSVLILAYSSNLMGGLTHYSLAPAPALFGAGYNSLKSWWLCGFVISVFNLSIFGGVGWIWWQFLGWTQV